MIAAGVLDAIGNTPIVELRKVVPPRCARVLVKLEYANPTGSMKDRMAKGVMEAAESDGRLRPVSIEEARQMAGRLGKGATVVTILVDSGLRYVSTELYK